MFINIMNSYKYFLKNNCSFSNLEFLGINRSNNFLDYKKGLTKS
jgi:hypothetical protein